MRNCFVVFMMICVSSASALAISPSEFKERVQVLEQKLSARQESFFPDFSPAPPTSVNPPDMVSELFPPGISAPTNPVPVNPEDSWAIYGVPPEQSPVKVVFEKVPFVAGHTHTQIVPQYNGAEFKISVQYDSTVEKDPGLFLRHVGLVLAISKANFGLTTYSNLNSFYILAELISNANAGHARAKERLTKAYFDLAGRDPARITMQYLTSVFGSIPNLERHIEKNWERLSRELVEDRSKALAQESSLKKQYKQWADQDQTRDAFEKMDDKLNDLVLKNDRRGVRKLIETYLPWILMAPSEVRAWTLWLEAIEHPRKDKSILALRGVEFGNDKVQRLQLPSGEVRFGFLSPVLTKNQGNYTRRLRSLVTNRLVNGVANNEKENFFSGFPFDPSDAKKKKNPEAVLPSAPIANQMDQHATDARASSFLSFTDSLKVAASFATYYTIKGEIPGALLAVQIDSRRMIPNVVSVINHEREYLVPLIVFPDEVVAYVEIEANKAKPGAVDAAEWPAKNVKEAVEKLRAIVQKKTGIDVKKYSAKPGSYHTWGHEFMQQVSVPNPNSGGKTCRGLF